MNKIFKKARWKASTKKSPACTISRRGSRNTSSQLAQNGRKSNSLSRSHSPYLLCSIFQPQHRVILEIPKGRIVPGGLGGAQLCQEVFEVKSNKEIVAGIVQLSQPSCAPFIGPLLSCLAPDNRVFSMGMHVNNISFRQVWISGK